MPLAPSLRIWGASQILYLKLTPPSRKDAGQLLVQMEIGKGGEKVKRQKDFIRGNLKDEKYTEIESGPRYTGFLFFRKRPQEKGCAKTPSTIH